MIDLDELLNGNPTWEQVIEFWKDDGDFCEEHYLIQAIEKYLLTEEQRLKMFNAKLSIEKMLNGRCTDRTVVNDIFNEWNTKLGFTSFGS
jgi:hypothetical protein